MRTMWLIGILFEEGPKNLKIDLTSDLLSFSDNGMFFFLLLTK